MNWNRRFVSGLAIVTFAALSTAAAHAYTAMTGSFTLPEQAYWGDTLLPAGTYNLSLEKGLTGLSMVAVSGEGVEAKFMAPASAQAVSERSTLKVDEVNGTYVVRELSAGILGKTYRFPVSKGVRNMTLRGSNSHPVTIPVSSGAGL